MDRYKSYVVCGRRKHYHTAACQESAFTQDKKIERKAAEVFAALEMESKYSKEEIFDKAKHFNDLSSENLKYHALTISVSEKLINEWKAYCKEVKLFTASQFTTDALIEMMNINIEDLKGGI